MKTIRNIVVVVVTVLGFSTVIGGGVSTSWRRIAEGDTTPEFSAVDTAGTAFEYRRSSGKRLVLVFLSSENPRSQQAVEDVYSALSSIPTHKGSSIQVAFVLQDVRNSEVIASFQEDAPCAVHILGDDQYQIWGKFGIIATPTVLISDAQGRVLCVKPGLAYDLEPVVKSRLFQALGMPYDDVSPENASTVRTVTNSTVSAKARRHLKIARLLMEKGRAGSAIEQAQMAFNLDPSSAEVALELGDLLCRARRSDQAQKTIRLVSDVSCQGNRDKARINLALGWANRELGNLREAETYLQEGINQDPTSPRLFFELGRIYQAHRDSDKAMQAYFQALQLIYQEE